MSATVRAGGIPGPVLIAAAALLAFTIGGTLFSRVSGVGATRLVETRAVESLTLDFTDRADGAIEARDATDGSLVYLVKPGEDGFIRGTVRGLAQARKRAGAGLEAPFRLSRWSDGTISLSDDADGRTVELDAFGSTNANAFAEFFSKPDTVK